ncbi:MAG: hypothetical protein C9356_15985 [Oleiphilus sp.]|nr:MAG: hypothetical protein C9356_15985 [Oleiphilus sp.]
MRMQRQNRYRVQTRTGEKKNVANDAWQSALRIEGRGETAEIADPSLLPPPRCEHKQDRHRRKKAATSIPEYERMIRAQG